MSEQGYWREINTFKSGLEAILQHSSLIGYSVDLPFLHRISLGEGQYCSAKKLSVSIDACLEHARECLPRPDTLRRSMEELLAEKCQDLLLWQCWLPDSLFD